MLRRRLDFEDGPAGKRPLDAATAEIGRPGSTRRRLDADSGGVLAQAGLATRPRAGAQREHDQPSSHDVACGNGGAGGLCKGALSDPVPSWVVEGAAMRAKQAVGPVVAAMTAQEERAAADRAKVLSAPPEDGNYMYARGDHDATVYLRVKEPVIRSVRCPDPRRRPCTHGLTDARLGVRASCAQLSPLGQAVQNPMAARAAPRGACQRLARNHCRGGLSRARQHVLYARPTHAPLWLSPVLRPQKAELARETAFGSSHMCVPPSRLPLAGVPTGLS